MLSSFAAEINLTSDPTAGTSRMDLSLTISGISLATLSIRGGYIQRKWKFRILIP
ncbi:MAG: hypothetical protein ACLR2E_16360 [Lachnospiraceae bacterium]